MISTVFRRLLPVSLLSALVVFIGCSTGASSAALQQRKAMASVLDAYAQAMRSGDYTNVRFTSEVSFVGPLTNGAINGEAQVKDFLRKVSMDVGDIRVRRQIIDGEFASVIAELETKNGIIVPFSEFFRVVDGKIAEIHPYFDPRPLIR
jgi:limonene-1,2-epoxide hydrolase